MEGCLRQVPGSGGRNDLTSPSPHSGLLPMSPQPSVSLMMLLARRSDCHLRSAKSRRMSPISSRLVALVRRSQIRPKFINFCRGDVDSASEVSDDDYTVAQFPRTTNPAFRSSSPTHTHAPSQSSPSARGFSEERDIQDDDDPTPHRVNSGRPPPLNYKQNEVSVPPDYSPSQHGPLQTGTSQPVSHERHDSILPQRCTIQS